MSVESDKTINFLSSLGWTYIESYYWSDILTISIGKEYILEEDYIQALVQQKFTGIWVKNPIPGISILKVAQLANDQIRSSNRYIEEYEVRFHIAARVKELLETPRTRLKSLLSLYALSQ
jgi:hypothetical protein